METSRNSAPNRIIRIVQKQFMVMPSSVGRAGLSAAAAAVKILLYAASVQFFRRCAWSSCRLVR